MSISPECVADVKSEIGESAVWDHRRGTLWWVDMFKGQLLEWNPATGDVRIASEIDQSLGFVVPKEDGTWLAGVRDGFGVIDEDGEFHLTVSVDADKPDYRMNDGKTDGHGRVWAGTMSDKDPVNGCLYRLETDGSVSTLRNDLQLPNGIAWSRNGDKMYVTDSNAYEIEVWTLSDDELPEPIEHVTSFKLGPDLGKPDGIAVDEEDGLWVALFGGGAVIRFNSDGAIDERVEMPVPNVTTLAFGGQNLDELFITTARYAMTAQDLAANIHLAGAIFKCSPGVRGLPVVVLPS